MTLFVHLNSMLVLRAVLDQARVCAEGETVRACRLARLPLLWL